MNSFFYKPYCILYKKCLLLFELLQDFQFTDSQLTKFIEAYNYFIINPEKFDGATIVRDNFNIKNLDACAMLHDYMYVKFNVSVNLKNKFKADLLYCKLLRKFNASWSSVWIVRFLGLIISSPFFALYKKIKYKLVHSKNDNLLFKEFIKVF